MKDTSPGAPRSCVGNVYESLFHLKRVDRATLQVKDITRAGRLATLNRVTPKTLPRKYILSRWKEGAAVLPFYELVTHSVALP